MSQNSVMIVAVVLAAVVVAAAVEAVTSIVGFVVLVMEQPLVAVDYEIEYVAKRLTCNSAVAAAETPAVDVVVAAVERN